MNTRVRNYHLDGYGRVSNTRYLRFLEEARWAFFEQHGLLSALKGIMFVVARAGIRYRRPVIEGDRLHFGDHLKEMTSRHIVLVQIITLPNDKSAVEVEITMMAINVANGRNINIPTPLSTALKTIAAR